MVDKLIIFVTGFKTKGVDTLPSPLSVEGTNNIPNFCHCNPPSHPPTTSLHPIVYVCMLIYFHIQDSKLSSYRTDIDRCHITYKVSSIFSLEVNKGYVFLLFMSSTTY